MASSYTNGTSTISSYAAVLRTKSDNCSNSNDVVTTRTNHNNSTSSNRSVGTSSVGDSDDGHDTTDWPELKSSSSENPWHTNPSAAAVIAMKFPPAVPDTLNDPNNSHKSSNSGKGSVQTSSSSSSSSSYSSTSSAKSENSLSGKNVGLGKTPPGSANNNKGKAFSGSPIKSSSHTKSGDSSSLPPRNTGRGRGRGGVSRGRGSYRGKNNYHHNHNYYPDDSSVTTSTTTREDYKDFPPDFTTLTPMYATPVSDFIMPYLATFPPATAFAPPLETTGILTLTTEEQPFPFVTVDAMTIEMVKHQIEYYFSEENLEKDFYLRRKMDSEGYLPVQLIASFHRVKAYDYSVVVAAIQSSEKLELTDDMAFVRTVNSPTKWPILDSVVLSISLFKAMKIDPMLPSPASSIVDTEFDDGASTASPIDTAIPSPSNVINLQSTIANGNGEMLNPNVPEFVPKSKVSY